MASRGRGVGRNWLANQARERTERLRERGIPAYLYGSGGPLETECDTSALGGLNAFFLLVDTPETYGLPPRPTLPSRHLVPSSILSAVGAALVALMGLVSFRTRGARRAPGATAEEGRDERRIA